VRHALTAAVVAAVALATSAESPAQPEPSPSPPTLRVLPGVGIGPYRLELGVEGLVARLGRAGAERAEVDMEEATRGCTLRASGRVVRFTWRREGLWLTADAQTRAVRVLAAFGPSGPFVTDRGVRLGYPLVRAEALYGPPPQRVDCLLDRGMRARILRYRELGIQFTALYGPTPAHGRVFEVGVFRPGTL
jgi:hypothetical protein